MRNRTCLFIATAVLVFITSVPAFALWGRYPNDEPVKADLPQSILKAVNGHKRVWGEGGDLGWKFYFHGTTNDVNAFLSQLAPEQTASLEAVPVPEAGSDKPEPFNNDHKVDYEWALWVYRTGDLFFLEPKNGEADADYEKRRAAELAKLPKYGAVVTIHCVGAVDPTTLKIPLAFRMSVGGRLANLVDFHNRRRSELEANGKPIAAEPPTDMSAAEAPHAVFGGPSTKPVGGDGG
jgi:hypothetical protein